MPNTDGSSDTRESGDPIVGETGWQTLAPLIDLVTPMAVRAAATLSIADHLDLDSAPVPVADLAGRTGTDPDALARLLRHLVNHGMFTEPSPGSFALNETAALLRSDHPSGMRISLDLDGFGGRMDLAFTELVHTVRTGDPAWQLVFGKPFWDYVTDDPAMSASFDATMSAGAEYVRDDARAYDWSTVRHVVDVGGGDGALLSLLLDAHPDLRATLVELPGTVDRARRRLDGSGPGGRIEFVGRSFFDPLPGGHDLYVLNSVLHDWPDDDARAILRRCADAAGRAGRVLVIEESARPGADQAEMDLRMLVLCGGRERTTEEYTALAASAGLSVTDVRTTPLGQTALVCVPDGA